MNRITHIALRVEDAKKTSSFYETVIGFEHVSTLLQEGKKGSHTSRHLTDGSMDLTLMQYDNDEAEEADLAGPAPCIHHFAIEVDDVEAFTKSLIDAGGKVLSEPGKVPVKFRAPGGPIAEVVPIDTFKIENLTGGLYGPEVE
jgi:lactoylglutathione lyase